MTCYRNLRCYYWILLDTARYWVIRNRTETWNVKRDRTRNPNMKTCRVKFLNEIVPSRIFDFPSPPRVRCPLGDDRFAICGPRDWENEIVPKGWNRPTNRPKPHFYEGFWFWNRPRIVPSTGRNVKRRVQQKAAKLTKKGNEVDRFFIGLTEFSASELFFWASDEFDWERQQVVKGEFRSVIRNFGIWDRRSGGGFSRDVVTKRILPRVHTIS